MLIIEKTGVVDLSNGCIHVNGEDVHGEMLELVNGEGIKTDWSGLFAARVRLEIEPIGDYKEKKDA